MSAVHIVLDTSYNSNKKKNSISVCINTYDVHEAQQMERRMKKRGKLPPKTLTKRRKLLFADGEVLNVHVVFGSNPTAQSDSCSFTAHYSSYMDHHCLLTAQRPTPCGTGTLLSETPNVRAGEHICAPRACV